MGMVGNVVRRGRTIGAIAAIVAGCAVTASAAPITFSVGVNTAAVAGTIGFIDLQFNPGSAASEPATAVISAFAQMGGALAASPVNTGSVAGALPGTVTFTNSAAFNDLFQRDTFGSTFAFTVTFDGLALAPPAGTVGSVFSLSLFNADGFTPLLTSNPDGFLLQLFLTPNGTVSVSNLNTAAVTVTPVTGSAVPEPSMILLLGAGVFGVAAEHADQAYCQPVAFELGKRRCRRHGPERAPPVRQ